MIEGAQVVFWHWFVLAALFVAIEMIAPGTFMLWLGAAALMVGVVLWIIPDASLAIQLTVFAICAVSSVFGWRYFQRRNPTSSEAPTLNQRMTTYMFKTYVLVEPIVNGTGLAKVEDSVWSVSGPDLPKGTKVRVVGIDGTILKVTAAED